MKKTSLSNSFLTFFSTFILFVLFITGCTSQNDALKNQVETSLMNESKLSDVTFNGSAEVHIQLPSNESNPFYDLIQTFSENGKLTWDGNIVDDSMEINTSLESNQTSLNVPIIITNDKLFFNIPLINPEYEYFEAEKNELLTKKNIDFETLYTQFLLELINKTDAQMFMDTTIEKTEEPQDQIIEIKISQQDLVLVVKDFLLNEMKEVIPKDILSNIDQTLNTYLPAENDETQEVQTSLITFIMDSNGEITGQNLELKLKNSTNQSLTIHHQISSNQDSIAQIKTPEQTISLIDFFTYLDELGSLPEFTFEPGIFIPETLYADQSVEQEILTLINKNLAAMIEKNKDQFFSTFSSEKNAEIGWELTQNNLYRFLQVEDLQFKNKSGKTINVGVLYESVDGENSDQKSLMNGFTFTINKVESEWKIQKIK